MAVEAADHSPAVSGLQSRRTASIQQPEHDQAKPERCAPAAGTAAAAEIAGLRADADAIARLGDIARTGWSPADGGRRLVVGQASAALVARVGIVADRVARAAARGAGRREAVGRAGFVHAVTGLRDVAGSRGRAARRTGCDAEARACEATKIHGTLTLSGGSRAITARRAHGRQLSRRTVPLRAVRAADPRPPDIRPGSPRLNCPDLKSRRRSGRGGGCRGSGDTLGEACRRVRGRA